MARRKRRSLALKLPLPRALPKKEPERCDECGAVMDVGRGYGYCNACHCTTPLPIARVVSKGPYKGKLVYLKSALMREMNEEYEGHDAQLAFDEELRCRDYLIVEEIDS
jgi:hypothetical protein